ncbi:MAG: hypothetical protein QOH47_2115 [Sphingomonadales bacterium]|jgi:peptidoglycan/LPS O-acetylase OafA/YrhL|nr:hypothetical protein [Sphingomonadales bacterium]
MGVGFVRLLLAVTVVLEHAAVKNALVGGALAVQLFFVLSGYLISHVLLTKDGYARPSRFYLNRALRIFPAYWAVALLMLGMRLFEGQRLAEFAALPPGTQAALGVANLAIFGQDAAYFMPNEVGIRFLLLPQSWSLAIELCFYLMAPFLIPRPQASLGRPRQLDRRAPASLRLRLRPGSLGVPLFPFRGRLLHRRCPVASSSSATPRQN